MYEFSKSTEMLDLVRFNIPSNQLKRKRPRDRARDRKIKYFTGELEKELPDFTVADFLEAMACKDILPASGKIHIYNC